jgi:hypothetical protein
LLNILDFGHLITGYNYNLRQIETIIDNRCQLMYSMSTAFLLKLRGSMYAELDRTLQYIIETLTNSELPQTYSKLAQMYESIRATPTDEGSANILALEQDLIETQLLIEPINFDKQSRTFFHEFDSDHVLGYAGHSKTKTIISETRNDPGAVAKKLQEVANQLSQLLERTKAAIASLAPVFKPPQPLAKDEMLLEIVFSGNVGFNDFDSMTNRAKYWVQIVEMVKKVVPGTSDGVEFVSIYMASPASIILKGKIQYITTIASLVAAGITIQTNLLNQELIRLQIQQAHIEPQRVQIIIEQLDGSKEDAISHDAEVAMDKFVLEHKELYTKDTLKQEAKSTGEVVIKHLYNFTVNGGEISIVNYLEPSPPADEKDEIRLLKKKYEEITRLKKKTGNVLLPQATFSPSEEQKIHDVVEESRAVPTPPDDSSISEKTKKVHGNVPTEHEAKPIKKAKKVKPGEKKK